MTSLIQCQTSGCSSLPRSCTDVICCLIFIVFLLGMAVVSIIGYARGNPVRLVYPTDSHGNICGFGKHRFGVQKLPIYINMVREPLDRLVSYYYFVRYGDDFRPSLRRRKSGDHESFDECVARDGKDCDPENLWVQVPYFCGHHADCWEPGSSWALEEAKRNLLHQYLLVGITEELRDFIAILEATLPRFFRGASQLYAEVELKKMVWAVPFDNKDFQKQITRLFGHSPGHDANRRKRKKIRAKPSTLAKLNKSSVWKLEKDFFDFAAKLFHYHKRLILRNRTSKGIRNDKRFHYGKVRPKESEDIKLMA
ncbi:Heparan sulfate 2-O-sulfotransferase 1 [Bulinus truncatus]|nr:Heparan sulfate 2-O-sulfotransferase 1 [Bulinus truncatus]